MYGNLYAREMKGQGVKPEYRFIKMFILCLIIGLLFLTGYENDRIMQEISSELQNESFLGETAGEKKEGKIRIILDVGHGGRDVGSSYEGIYEKDINYEVAKDLQKYLESMGAEAILSGDGDTLTGEYERVKVANGKTADLFISIHCDCHREDAGMSGMEFYYDGSGYPGMEYADALAAALHQNGGIKCNGIRQGNFYVLKNTYMPAVLVKLGSLSDSEDRRKLTEADYRERLAEKLAESIMLLF